MAGDSRRRIVRNVAAAISVVLAFTAEVTVGQVVIEERVVLRRDSAFARIDSAGKVATSVSWIEPEFDGYLLLYYAAGSKLSEPIDPQAEVMVEINDVLTGRDTVMQSNRLVFNTSGPNNNQYCMPYSTLEHYYSQGPSATWRVGHVDKGDKVQVGYDPKEDYQVASFYDYDGAVWDIDIYHPNCYAPSIRYDERLLLAAVVTRDTLTVEIDEPKTVWPSIAGPNTPNRKQGAQSAFDFTSVVDSIGLTVTLEDQGSPVEGTQVIVTAQWLDNSGGHSHTSPAFPTEWFKFRDLANPAQKVDASITVSTDSDGKANLRFFAPPWGGRVRLHASATYSSVELTDVDSVEVEVPDLEPLTTLNRVGGTCDHHGASDKDIPQNCKTPDNNHYATASVVSAIEVIAAEWAVIAESLPKTQAPLKVNDISLPSGGKFSINANWEYGKHKYHRVGRDVDIRTQKLLASRTGVLVTGKTWKDTDNVVQTTRSNPDFVWLVVEHGGFPDPAVHSPGNDSDTEFGMEHYHLYFYGD